MTKKKQDPDLPKDRVPLSLAERSTLRDQIAMRVLARCIPEHHATAPFVDADFALECAKCAYAWADVMLRAREE